MWYCKTHNTYMPDDMSKRFHEDNFKTKTTKGVCDIVKL